MAVFGPKKMAKKVAPGHPGCLFACLLVLLHFYRLWQFVNCFEMQRFVKHCFSLWKKFDFLLFRFVSLHYTRFGNRRTDGRPRWRRTLYSLRQFNDVRQSLHDCRSRHLPPLGFTSGTGSMLARTLLVFNRLGCIWTNCSQPFIGDPTSAPRNWNTAGASLWKPGFSCAGPPKTGVGPFWQRHAYSRTRIRPSCCPHTLCQRRK